jgi:hypothetical protein
MLLITLFEKQLFFCHPVTNLKQRMSELIALLHPGVGASINLAPLDPLHDSKTARSCEIYIEGVVRGHNADSAEVARSCVSVFCYECVLLCECALLPGQGPSDPTD